MPLTYAIIKTNINGNPSFSFRAELRESNDDGLIASHELTASDVDALNIELYEPINPLLLPLDILVDLRRNLLEKL